MCRNILFALVLLGSIAFATNVPANFRSDVGEPYHFNTNMQFTTDFTLSATTSGDVVSGDPNNLQTGDVICSGATLNINPTVNAKWAVSSLDIQSLYPDCLGYGYCPAMITYATLNTNSNVGWISTAKYNDHNSFGDSNPFTQTPSRYDDLGAFHNQRTTYYNLSGTYNNKRSEANVFCKGSMQVLDGTTVLPGGSSSMPSIPSPSFTVTSTGLHTIKSRLQDVECIAVAAKNPLDKTSHTEWFYMYYYTENQPDIDATIALDTISLTVQEAGGTCSMGETSIARKVSPYDEDIIMVMVTMHNSGDHILVTGVTGSNPGFVVEPLNVASCSLMFLPSDCPGSNGFNQSVAPGGDKVLYVTVQRTPSASGGTVLNFEAETVAMTCGSQSTCDDDVNLGGPIFCEIEPPSLTYGTNEIAEFLVTCQNLANETVPCVGDNWYWDGISGGFVEKDSTHALAYPTSSPGSSGTLNYETNIAHCQSDVDVTTPFYECEFIPPAANMETGESEYFELNCFAGDDPSTPDDADYDTSGGLDGSIGNSSTGGTTFTAGSNSSGNLNGYAYWDDPSDDPVLGAIANADITIGDGGSGNDTNTTNGGGDDDDGSSEWCTIGEGPLSVTPGYYGWVPIGCGPSGDQPCNNVTWWDDGEVDVSDWSDSGTYINVTGEPGEKGWIYAYTDGDASHSCYRGFTIQKPECWEFS